MFHAVAAVIFLILAEKQIAGNHTADCPIQASFLTLWLNSSSRPQHILSLNSGYKKAMVRLVLTGILLVLLTACSTSGIVPSSQLVQRGLALELKQTQQQLSKQLGLDVKGFEIKRVEVTQREPLEIQNLPAYHVKGRYDVTMQLPKRRVSGQHNSFDIYLQRQKEGKTWRLAIPKATDNDTQTTWFTYLIE